MTSKKDVKREVLRIVRVVDESRSWKGLTGVPRRLKQLDLLEKVIAFSKIEQNLAMRDGIPAKPYPEDVLKYLHRKKTKIGALLRESELNATAPSWDPMQ